MKMIVAREYTVPGRAGMRPPGCHHVRSETAGSEEALFVANLVVTDKVFQGLDLAAEGLEADFAKIGRIFIIDKDVEEQNAAASGGKGQNRFRESRILWCRGIIRISCNENEKVAKFILCLSLNSVDEVKIFQVDSVEIPEA